jgi:hypothetical protein
MEIDSKSAKPIDLRKGYTLEETNHKELLKGIVNLQTEKMTFALACLSVGFDQKLPNPIQKKRALDVQKNIFPFNEQELRELFESCQMKNNLIGNHGFIVGAAPQTARIISNEHNEALAKLNSRYDLALKFLAFASLASIGILKSPNRSADNTCTTLAIAVTGCAVPLCFLSKLTHVAYRKSRKDIAEKNATIAEDYFKFLDPLIGNKKLEAECNAKAK